MAQQLQTRDPSAPQAKKAFDVETRIKGRVRAMRTMWIELAEDLHEFSKNDMWRDLGWRSFEQWLASPEVEISRRQAYYLLDTWRELVVKRGVKPAELEKVEISKVQEVLPAIRRGYADVPDALSDCESLARDDLRSKYAISAKAQTAAAPAGDDALDAESEPERYQCETCGSWLVKRSG